MMASITNDRHHNDQYCLVPSFTDITPYCKDTRTFSAIKEHLRQLQNLLHSIVHNLFIEAHLRINHWNVCNLNLHEKQQQPIFYILFFSHKISIDG